MVLLWQAWSRRRLAAAVMGRQHRFGLLTAAAQGSLRRALATNTNKGAPILTRHYDYKRSSPADSIGPSSSRSLSFRPRRDGISIPSGRASCLGVNSAVSSSHLNRFFSTAAAATNDNDGTSATIPFLLADIGEGILEVELLQWFVREGDAIRQFDKVCEVQSDKATVEITSRYDGIVAQLTGGAVGDLVRVGQPLLMMQVETAVGSDEWSTSRDSMESSSLTSAVDYADERLHIPTIGSQFHLSSDDDEDTNKTDGVSTTDSSPFTGGGSASKYQASPAVRKLGAEYKIDLSTIRPSGPSGRLLKSDVVTYLQEQGLWRVTTMSGDHGNSLGVLQSPAAQLETDSTTTSIPSNGPKQDEIIQLKGYNRLMVQTMTASLQIPHMGFSDELIVNKLLDSRKDLNSSMEAGSTNISLLVFLTKAASLALAEYPMVNAQVHSAADYQVKLKTDHNIGIAMDTPRGLVVPVLKQVQTKSLLELQEELNMLKQLAAASQLAPEHLSDGTFTLSNIGSMGCGTYMQPVIVSPQLAMGAIGSIRTLPRFASDMDGTMTTADVASRVVAAQVLTVSWAGDHRFLDGATLARFHKSFKRYVEHPVHMLAHLK